MSSGSLIHLNKASASFQRPSFCSAKIRRYNAASRLDSSFGSLPTRRSTAPGARSDAVLTPDDVWAAAVPAMAQLLTPSTKATTAAIVLVYFTASNSIFASTHHGQAPYLLHLSTGFKVCLDRVYWNDGTHLHDAKNDGSALVEDTQSALRARRNGPPRGDVVDHLGRHQRTGPGLDERLLVRKHAVAVAPRAMKSLVANVYLPSGSRAAPP